MSVIDYGDIIYMHATASTLKSLDATYPCALRFITGASYRTHHCEWHNMNILAERLNSATTLALFVT